MHRSSDALALPAGAWRAATDGSALWVTRLGEGLVSVFLGQLTGIRFVAAGWVVLYHTQGPLGTVGMLAIPVVGDVVRVGSLGVDLFFALSGFILTHTYLSRLGPRLRGRYLLHFWWLRLARVYPVHLAMIVIAGSAVVVQARVFGEALDRDWLNPLSLIRNLALIQEWGPRPDHGWNFVAWSLSMEWLAYLLFPFLALLLLVLDKHAPTPALVALWFATLVPLLWYGLSMSDPFYTDRWGSTYRVLTEFTAGAIACLIVSRVHGGNPTQGLVSPRIERAAAYLSAILPLVVVAGAVVLGRLPQAQPPSIDGASAAIPPYFHLLLVPFLIAWIGALAVSRGRVARFLSSRTLVAGGFISYSLYMTYLVWLALWQAATDALHVDSGPIFAAAVIGLLAGSLGIAWLMWRLVEQPARETLRALVGARRVPTEEAGEAIAEKRPRELSADPVVLSE
jgi:peptidoglycan/LPS O-acetylase OafA/YrhL